MYNLIYLGLTNENIANELGILPTAIRTYLAVADRQEAVALAERLLVEIEGS